MIFYIFYGEISDDRLIEWDNGKDDPFAVLKKNNQIESGWDWMKFFGWARKNLSDEINIDWGSFAWKATGKEIIRLRTGDRPSVSERFDEIDPDGIYGVVFIEMS